jgi:hypothetical protein
MGPERGAETAKRRELVRVDLWHAAMMPLASRGRLARLGELRASDTLASAHCV